ncbi:MAG: DNA internalization-related competence protein ComEC/Rec2 [Firmicutes bacterium]|nr:DNA internalization-related competence protein ComEC/Rec2 [Bacillota bacterium]
MKRPLLLFLYAAALGIILAYYTHIALWQLCLVEAAAFFVLFSRFRSLRPRILCCASAALIIFAVGFIRMDMALSKQSAALAYEGGYAAFSGTVTSCSQKEGYLAIYVKLDSVHPALEYLQLTAAVTGADAELSASAERRAEGSGLSAEAAPGSPAAYERGGKAFRESVLLRLETEDEQLCYELPGRRVAFSGAVERPSGIRNLFGFDYSRYLRSRGVMAIVRCSRFRFSAGEVRRPLTNALSKSKGRFFSHMREHLEEDEFAVASGLIFGAKDRMDEDQREQYRRSGISHILAVSGLHVGLLYGVLTKLIKSRGWAGDAAVCAALLCYVLLSEASVSVLRASLMVILRMLSFRLRRRYDLVSAAALCSLIFCLREPFTLFDSGFQLSFAAAYSIGIALPWAELKITEISDRKRSERFYRIGMLLTPSVMIQLAMMPLIIYDFLCFSPASFAVNPLAVFIAGLELPLGLTAYAADVSLGGFGGPLGTAGHHIMALLCAGIGALSRALNILSAFSSRFSRDVCAPPFGLLALYYMVFFFFFSDTRAMLRRRKLGSGLAAASALMALCCSALPYLCGVTLTPLPWRYSLPLLSFVDVGQGDCVHVTSEGLSVLVDGGGSFYSSVGEDTLLPYFLKNGVKRIDLAFVTHPDMDHSKGLEELSRLIPIGVLFYPGVYWEETFEGIEAEEKTPLFAGDSVSFGGLSLEVILPAAGDALSPDANSNSLVMMLRAEGFSAMLTADMDMAMEDRLLREGADLSCEVLKAAHHGSAYSGGESFIAAAAPVFEVISCGRNNSYGHPAPRVIDLAEENGIIYGRTDEDGAILVKGVKNGHLEARNAAGDRIWRIPMDRAQPLSIRSRP